MTYAPLKKSNLNLYTQDQGPSMEGQRPRYYFFPFWCYAHVCFSWTRGHPYSMDTFSHLCFKMYI